MSASPALALAKRPSQPCTVLGPFTHCQSAGCITTGIAITWHNVLCYEEAIIFVFGTNFKIFAKSSHDFLLEHIITHHKKIINMKRKCSMNLSILGIVAGNRIHKVINCSFEIESIGWLLLSHNCGLQKLLALVYICTTVCPGLHQSVRTECRIKGVPPSAGCVIPVGRLLHARSNVWWISNFRRDLTNGVTSLIVCFALEECCSQIHVKYIPTLICGCLGLDCKAEATPGCSRTFCLLIILLLVLEASEDPASLGLQEVTILVSL